ncbi:transposase [Agromyces laixinhei]|uniref:transposase n=1 Tax=Agromyces laixinhei TaxID=2585717 RepID=UPI0012EDFE82|nr:transposase [Agromyces laixinhei]
MPADALVNAATELYALRPDEFTAARNARAQSAGADDRELGAGIRELRRPSPAAWLVNQLVRRRADQVQAVLTLGAEARAREVRGALDTAELAELGRQRRRLVSALARDAGALAEELGAPVRAPVLDEVAQTLQAAMSDAAAADAVRSGRLVRALEAVGVEVELSGAVAGGPAPRTEQAGAAGDSDAADDAAAASDAAPAMPSGPDRRAARKRAERAVEAAELRAAEASAALEAVDARLADANGRHADRAARRVELEQQLRRVEQEIAEVDRATRSLTRERERAAGAAHAAEVDVDDAREAFAEFE